jgi:hypothetical protein
VQDDSGEDDTDVMHENESDADLPTEDGDED